MNDRIAFRIHGMDCADEVALLRRELEPLVQAPDRLSFDILRGKMLVGPGEHDRRSMIQVPTTLQTGR
jgi:Zn2+/Cd2+-exporting ATPase